MADLCRSHTGSQYKLSPKFTLLPEHTQSRDTCIEWLGSQLLNTRFVVRTPVHAVSLSPSKGETAVHYFTECDWVRNFSTKIGIIYIPLWMGGHLSD